MNATTAARIDPLDQGGNIIRNFVIAIIIVYFAMIPLFWHLEVNEGVSHSLATNTMTILQILCYVALLVFPWLRLPGRQHKTTSQRLSLMIIIWCFICLTPRFTWELPWLFFLDQIREGVNSGALWSYTWSPYLIGGDARYLNGDPLVVVLEWIAVFVGAFEGYALWKFFSQGKSFTNVQLSFIMAGMIVEVTLPAIYFGVEIANNMENVASPADLIIKFALLNSFWCTLPLVTFFWGLGRVARQDLKVEF